MKIVKKKPVCVRHWGEGMRMKTEAEKIFRAGYIPVYIYQYPYNV